MPGVIAALCEFEDRFDRYTGASHDETIALDTASPFRLADIGGVALAERFAVPLGIHRDRFDLDGDRGLTRSIDGEQVASGRNPEQQVGPTDPEPELRPGLLGVRPEEVSGLPEALEGEAIPVAQDSEGPETDDIGERVQGAAGGGIRIVDDARDEYAAAGPIRDTVRRDMGNGRGLFGCIGSEDRHACSCPNTLTASTGTLVRVQTRTRQEDTNIGRGVTSAGAVGKDADVELGRSHESPNKL